jgi:hypothetical protein
MSVLSAGRRLAVSLKNVVGWNTWDAIFLAAIGLSSIGLILNTSQIARIPGFDLNSYIALAEHPMNFFSPTVTGIHSQRILGSFVVWVLSKLFPIVSIDLGFRIVSGFCFIAFATLFYLSLRLFRVSAFVAVGTTLFSMVASWPMTYSLGNIYQANDALVYPLAILIILCVLAKRPYPLLAVSILGVLARQNLVVLAVMAHVALALKTRKKAPVIGLVIVAGLFYLSSVYAGGGAVQSLSNTLAFDLREEIHGAVKMELWYYFSPFILVLLDPLVLRYAARYWWVTAFCVITVAQPLGMFSAIGGANAGRIAAGGIFPAFLVAGIIIDERIRSSVLKMVYAFLPLLYGNEHLAYVKYRLAPVWGDRRWLILLVYLLLILDWLWRHHKAVSTAIDRGAVSGREGQEAV